MKTFPCPACGAEITFYSPVSVYAVCAHCRSMVVRRDVNVEAIGVMADLPEDMSPVQLGSQGVFGSTPFTVVGRAKMAWSRGYWNEWYLWCDGGRRGWLAEAQGFFAVNFEMDEPWPAEVARAVSTLKKSINTQKILASGNPSLDHVPMGKSFQFNSMPFQLADVKLAHCIGSEGELPFTAARGRTAITLDFIGSDGGFACIEFSVGKERVFIGEYVDWNNLKMDGLRELEGWK